MFSVDWDRGNSVGKDLKWHFIPFFFFQYSIVKGQLEDELLDVARKFRIN